MEKEPRTSEMAQWVKGLADKPNELSSVPKTHMVEGDNCSMTPTYKQVQNGCVRVHTHTHAHTHTKQLNKYKSSRGVKGKTGLHDHEIVYCSSLSKDQEERRGCSFCRAWLAQV